MSHQKSLIDALRGAAQARRRGTSPCGAADRALSGASPLRLATHIADLHYTKVMSLRSTTDCGYFVHTGVNLFGREQNGCYPSLFLPGLWRCHVSRVHLVTSKFSPRSPHPDCREWSRFPGAEVVGGVNLISIRDRFESGQCWACLLRERFRRTFVSILAGFSPAICCKLASSFLHTINLLLTSNHSQIDNTIRFDFVKTLDSGMLPEFRATCNLLQRNKPA